MRCTYGLLLCTVGYQALDFGDELMVAFVGDEAIRPDVGPIMALGESEGRFRDPLASIFFLKHFKRVAVPSTTIESLAS
jgi:hypothetical protein